MVSRKLPMCLDVNVLSSCFLKNLRIGKPLATADWADLPQELLLLIAKCLETHFDILLFRSVCPSWRASVPLNLRPRPVFCYPILGIDKMGNESLLYKRTVCRLKFLADRKKKVPIFWLVMLEVDKFGKKHIRDPSSRDNYITLGRRFEELDKSKFHFQELGNEYVVVGKYGTTQKVAYLNPRPNEYGHFMLLMKEARFDPLYLFKSGDEESTPFEMEGWDRCEDFIQFKGNFYAVDIKGTTICIEPCSGVSFLESYAPTLGDGCKFLVESCGKLLLVERISPDSCSLHSSCLEQTLRFEVFRLDEERLRWDRLESLGDGILFLEGYCNFVAPATPGVQGNCVVFTVITGMIAGTGYREKIEEKFVYNMSSRMTLPSNHPHNSNLSHLFYPSFLHRPL